jgi:hypothetical protein
MTMIPMVAVLFLAMAGQPKRPPPLRTSSLFVSKMAGQRMRTNGDAA